MSWLAIVTLWTHLFFLIFWTILQVWAQYRPVRQLPIVQKQPSPEVLWVVSLSARGWTWTRRWYLHINAVCLQFIQAQFLEVIVWAHSCEHCVERLEIALACILLHCGLSAIWVATEPKHQLHHLIESTVANYCGRGWWVASSMCDLLLLANTALRTWYLWNIDAKYRWLVVSSLLHIIYNAVYLSKEF